MNKGESFPFVVQTDSTRGRYLAATRDIKQGEVIFQERPLIVGPCGIGNEKSKSFSTCLGCYKNVVSLYKCSKCGFAVCNMQCEKMPDHANFECTVFADCPVSPITNPPEYEKIKILRCLMLKEKNPEKWRLLMGLQSHAENRKQDVYAVSCYISYYKFIKQECHLKHYTFEEINHFAGVSAINSYSTNGLLGHSHIDGHLRYASFLFYYASFLSHDCVPNSKAIIQRQRGKSYAISIIASINIKSGEPISAYYVEPNFGTLERREYLLENFYFFCKCQRCRDPSEIGSMMSAVKCRNQSCKGWLLSNDPLEPFSSWICDQVGCDFSMDSSSISNILQEVKLKIRQAQDLNDFANILEIYKGPILHKNHYLVINMECELIRLIDGLLRESDKSEMFRLAKWQIELCRHCLSVADLIQPGSSKFRGNLLYTLQEALLALCSFKINHCCDKTDLEIIRKGCKKQFAEALEIMKESKSILIAEPVGSFEWERGTFLSLETNRIKSLMAFLSFKD